MPTLLDHPVETLPGIGPTTGAHLRRRGYASVGDLLWLLPRGYDDQRTPIPIHRLRDGDYAVVEGVVRRARSFPRGGRMGFEARLEPSDEPPGHDGYRELKLLWFQAIPGLAKRFVEGETGRAAVKVHVDPCTATPINGSSIRIGSAGNIASNIRPETVTNCRIRKALRSP